MPAARELRVMTNELLQGGSVPDDVKALPLFKANNLLFSFYKEMALSCDSRGRVCVHHSVVGGRAGIHDETQCKAMVTLLEGYDLIRKVGRFTWIVNAMARNKQTVLCKRAEISRERKKARTEGSGIVAAVYKRDGNRCRYCGAAENLTIDHVMPLSLGGANTKRNMVVACKSCNSKKGSRTLASLGWSMLPESEGC